MEEVQYIHPPVKTLSALDYFVFGAVLVVSISIGLVFGCKGGGQKTTSEFLMANRQMSTLPVTLSILASFMSAITLLGTPAEIYVYGTQYLAICLGYCITIPLCIYVYHPVFYGLQLTSVFEYLELRFNRPLRSVSAVIYIVQMVMYMAIVLYAPSLALNAVTRFNVWAAVLSVGTACTFYTTLGGMKAVMWTDVFQICMMFIGLFAVLIQGSVDQGGFDQIWEYLKEGERVEFFNFDPNPLVRHTVWSLTLGGAFTWLAIYGVNQAQVQRIMTVPKLKQARVAVWINLPGLSALAIICSMCGMVVYAEYRDCDPLSSERISAMDQLLPLYVMDRLSVPGLPGLFTACLFSGALSTISSGLNSLAAVTLQDLVRNLWFHDMSEKNATRVSKFIAFGFGVLMISLTFVAAQLGGVLQAALALFGVLGGPVLGLYTLGILFPWANSKGASAGLAAGLAFTLWLGIGAQVHKPIVDKPPVSTANCTLENSTLSVPATAVEEHFTSMTPATNVTGFPVESEDSSSHGTGHLAFYEMSYLWYSACAIVVVNLVGMLVSLCTGFNRPEDVDGKLISPVLFRIFELMPHKLRSACHCFLTEPTSETVKDIQSSTDDLDNNVNHVYTNPAANTSIDVPYWHFIQYETHI